MEDTIGREMAHARQLNDLGVSDDRVIEIAKMIDHLVIDNKYVVDVMIEISRKLTHPGELVLAGCYISTIER